MIASRMQQLRRRIAAARAAEESEHGVVLVYVLIVTMLVTTAVTALVMTTTQAILPTQDSVNRTAAYAAAQAGIQDALAYVNTQCPKYGVRCDAALSASQTNIKSNTNVLAGSNQSFSWKIGSSYVTDNAYNRYLRVTSVGSSGGRSVALVADVQAVPSPLDYEYYSTYETNGSADVSALNPARTISIDCSTTTAVTSLSFSCPTGTSTTATWAGATAAVTAGALSPASPSPSVCDRLWYDSGTYDGSTGLGRATVQALQPTLPAGTDWKETGAVGATTVSRYVPCQVVFTNGQTFNGKVYTVDAPLVSNGTPNSTTSATFAGGLTTAWQTGNNPQAPTTYYRSDPNVGGTLASNAISQSNPLSFSPTFNPTPSAASCIFYGPTRVLLNGDGTATVTSPQTTTGLQTGQAGCYQTKNAAGQFTVNYKLYGNGVIYVKNNGTKPAGGYPSTGQTSTASPTASDTSFYLTNSAPASGTLDTSTATAPDTCSATSTYTGTNASANCAWSGASTSAGSTYKADGGGWTTYTNNTTNNNGCGGLAATDRLLFECEFNGGSISAGHQDYYQLFRQQRVQTPLSRTSISCSTTGQSFAPATATSSQLACFLNDALSPADSLGSVKALGTAASQHQYVATAGTPTVTTTTKTAPNATAPTAPVSGDGFFSQKAGSGASETVTTTTTTFTVNRETDTCSLLGLGNLCVGTWNWGGDVPQFQVTITQTAYSNLTAGTAAVSYFPSMNDVTQYGTGTSGANSTNGPGDVYIEGTNSAPLSVLSDNDTVITGNLKTTGSGATLIDALGDVRIYNPMSCKDQNASRINATTPGFCPDDLTGLYTGGLVTGSTLNAAHPAMQYTNCLTASGSTTANCDVQSSSGQVVPITTVSAALVAQGRDNSTGSIRTDNANRGSSDGTLTVTGGMYQRHRGALGVQWEYASTSVASRASSGYKVSMTYADLQNAGLTYVPAFQSGSVTRYWNVVSASTCTKVSSGVCVGNAS